MTAMVIASCQSIQNNEIWYTTTNGEVLDLEKMAVADAVIVSNKYRGGRGVIKCNKAIEIVGSSMFENCTHLQTITLPEGVVEIDDWAFSGCSNLTDIVLPQSLVKIDEGAFTDCSSLKSVTLPENVESVAHAAFRNCQSIASFQGKYASEDGDCMIIDSVLVAFAPEGHTSFTVPKEVRTIGESAFSYFDKLQSIIIPAGVTEIEPFAFAYCSGLKDILIPEGVTTIGAQAFADCVGLQNIALPQTLNKIAYRTFVGCTGFTEMVIPNGVALIEEGAFKGCSNLASLTLPESVSELEYWVFQGCSNLKTIYCKSETPPVFGYSGKLGLTLYVPRESVEAYSEVETWARLAGQILEYDFNQY